MANTINDLYLKYVNKVGRTLENDRYFQYLFEMVQAGENVLQQNHQILHKVVDERWLSMIEESLDSINNIIEKPRRFVTTKEEVVPVALARKITADSVRHLSMNTQFIASSEDGDIQPTRVLNVSTEESYDLYENRFVYHLIQRLVTFIDKRTDIIFWATGDETQNVLSYQSKVDDAYEEIEYKIEMKVKNRQSFAENDSDNMNVFMRIDRVRRMVMSLKNSAFCGLMAGCSKVRSPIQRTNLIMKDPDYRTCYKLWQFLENYDEVGYSIEVENAALQFDEEYLIQMYTNLITNYTVFKSLLDSDSRRPEELLGKKRRTIKPKFIKKIKEEIVDNYDLEDVEIRQVFIQEVTQAQLDAEAKLAEETEARKKAEEALEDMDFQMVSLQQQVSEMLMKNQEAEIRAEQERQAKEDALTQMEEIRARNEELQKQTEEERAQAEAARTRAEEECAEAVRKAEEAYRLLEEIKEQSALQIQEMQTRTKQQIDEAEARTAWLIEENETRTTKLIAEAEEQKAQEIAEARAEAKKRIAETEAQAKCQVEEIQTRADRRVEEIQTLADRRIEELQTETSRQMEAVREEAAQQIEVAKAEAWKQIEEQEIRTKRKVEDTEARARQSVEEAEVRAKQSVEEAQARAKQSVEDAEVRARTWITETEARTSKQVQELQEKSDAQLQKLLREYEELDARFEESEREKEQWQENARAEKERADANTLSHYIISALNQRKRKSDKDDET